MNVSERRVGFVAASTRKRLFDMTGCGVQPMKTTLAWLSCVLLSAIAAQAAFADDPVTNPVGSGVYVNSDCSWPLVARFQRCHVECALDRDCTGGWVCAQISVPGSPGTYGVCKAPPPPPPAPGGFTGRVERSRGEGLPCAIEVWRGSSMATRIGCDSASGSFSAENLPVGLYLLRVTAGAAPYVGKREFLAPVNAGEITYLGELVVLSPMIVNPANRPLPDVIREFAPNPSGSTRTPPQGGRDPPVR